MPRCYVRASPPENIGQVADVLAATIVVGYAATVVRSSLTASSVPKLPPRSSAILIMP